MEPVERASDWYQLGTLRLECLPDRAVDQFGMLVTDDQREVALTERFPLARTLGRCRRKKLSTDLRAKLRCDPKRVDLLENLRESHIRCETYRSIGVQEGQPT